MRRPAVESLDEAEQRQRVQRALGDGFELGRLLGRGGFAEVYAATDRKLQRTVAVKVLRPDLVVNRSLTERFLREARAAAKLRHPNIIPIYQVGEAEGLAYFLMPLIEGENLREHMERVGQLPIDESRRILREVAEALAVAHESGIVHRDIKPDNIMLDGKEHRAIVTDFGIAKALGSEEAGLTGTGMIVGTPHYMSPEQASGEREIDSRSDIYSLGVVGYHMLTGRLPFEGKSTQEVLMKHVTATAERIATLRPEVPPDLSAAIERCLSKRPADRWSGVGELAASLTPATSREPPSTRMRSSPVRAAWLAGAMLLAGLLVVLAVSVVKKYSGQTASDSEGWPAVDHKWKPLARMLRVGSYDWELGVRTTIARGTRWITTRGMPRPEWMVNVGDRYLLTASRGGDEVQMYDGVGWRVVHLAEELGSVEPFLYRDTAWVFTAKGEVHALTPSGLDARSQFATPPACVSAVWSNGVTPPIVGTCDGGMVRWGDGGWTRLPTGTAAPISAIVPGAGTTIYALAGFFRTQAQFNITRTDSVLTYDGADWRVVDPRPSEDMRAVVGYQFESAAAFPDGGVALGGSALHPDSSYIPLLLIREATATAWRRMHVPTYPLTQEYSFPFTPGHIWGRSLLDFYVWGRLTGRMPGQIVFHSDSGRLRREPELERSPMIAMTSFRGAVHALLSSGLVLRLRDGRWRIVTEVPHSVVRDIAISSVMGPVAVLDHGVVSVGGLTIASAERLRPPVGTFRRVVVRDSSLWMLTDSSQVFALTCRSAREFINYLAALAGRAPGPELIPLAAWECQTRALDRSTIPLLDIAATADGRLLAVGPGGVAVWSAGKLSPMPMPIEATRDTFERVATSADGGVAVIGHHVVLTWSVPRREWVARRRDAGGPTRDLTFMTGGVLAVAGGGDIALYRGDSLLGRAPGALMPQARLHALSDGRLIAGYAHPGDPATSGWLDVFVPPGYNHAERVTLPAIADIYGLADDGRYLYVVGSGWFAAQVLLDSLPGARARAR